MIDGEPSCVCHLGFYGERCEFIDVDGSGTALRLFAPPEPVVFNDADRLDSIPLSGAVHTGVWFYLDKLPTTFATIVAWRHGALKVDKNGAVSYCGARDSNCAKAAATVGVEQWSFASAVVQHNSRGFEIFLRVAVNAAEQEPAQRQWSGAVAPQEASEPFKLLDELGVRLGEKLAGRIDLLSISHKPADSTVEARFDEKELVQLRDEIVPTLQPGLVFYCMFDLKRGAHLYDNVNLLRAKLSDVGGRFVDSEIKLQVSFKFFYIQTY